MLIDMCKEKFGKNSLLFYLDLLLLGALLWHMNILTTGITYNDTFKVGALCAGASLASGYLADMLS